MLIAVDTETNGGDFFHGSRPFMVTATTEEKVNMLWGDTWNVNPYTRRVTPSQEDVDEISDLLWNNEIIFHNALFDIPALASIGCIDAEDYLENGTYHDTMVMASTIHNDGEKALKKLAVRVGFPDDDERDLIKAVESARHVTGRNDFKERHGEWRTAKKGDPTFPGVRSLKGGFRHFDYWLPRAVALAEMESGNPLFKEDHPWLTVCEKYATLDTERTYCLFHPMRNELMADNLWDRYKFTMSLFPAIWSMRLHGVPMYSGSASKVINRFREVSEFHLEKSSQMFGGINANSPKQLASYLDSRVKITNRTKGGQASTDEETLLKIRDNDESPADVKEAITHLLIGRKCDRSASLGENYLECLDTSLAAVYKEKGFGVIHSDLNPVGTPVNRFSSNAPNMQAVRKREWEMPEMESLGVHARQMFRPRKGRELIAIDFDQMHLRMVAYLSNEHNMIDVFELGGDIHTKTQGIIFQDDYVNGDAGQRRLAKDINFGYIYGAKRHKIAKYVNSSPLYKGNDGDRVYDRIVEEFPNAPIFLAQKEREAKQLGYILTADGLRLYLPYGKTYAAVNYYIQGTEGYLAKKALLNCYELLRKSDFPANIIMIIHDELLFEAPLGFHGTPLMLQLMNCMRSSGDEIGVKCEVEAKLSVDTWYDGKKLKLINGRLGVAS